jgi:putative transposase
VPENINLLRSIFIEIKQEHPFIIDAIVILPDHLHCLWTLPAGDVDYSMRWRLIKSAFSRQCQPQYMGTLTGSRHRKKEQAVWQRRFWEHKIKNDTDFRNHVEYIHYNPVKHGFISAPAEWRYSSFRRYVEQGLYEREWGAGKKMEFERDVGRE